jgi:hypothetical protein
MKTHVICVGVLAALLLFVPAAGWAAGVGGALAGPGGDVVLLRCTETASHPIGVAQSSSSAGAPVIAPDTSCAQALSDLLDAGFRIHSARGEDIFIYTLIRRGR